MNDDLIRRGELAEEVKSLTVHVTGLRAGKGVLQEYAKQYRDSLLRIIEEQPAVDAVSIEEYETMKADRDSWKDAFFEFNEIAVKPVRCKECIFKKLPRVYGNSIIGEVHCGMLGLPMNFNDFCSYGERRQDDAHLE